MNRYQQVVKNAEAKERQMRQEAERRQQLALWQYRLECSLIEDDEDIQPVKFLSPSPTKLELWHEERYKSA